MLMLFTTLGWNQHQTPCVEDKEERIKFIMDRNSLIMSPALGMANNPKVKNQSNKNI